MRWLVLVGLSAIACAQTLTPAETAELARATKNPFELARFIDNHPATYFQVIWKSPTLSVKPSRSAEEGICGIEVLSVMAPEQAFVIIECGLSSGDVYVRYTRKSDGTWKCEGAREVEIRDNPRRHEIDRRSKTPYLRVSNQGIHGTDVDSEFEQWFDLTRPGFDPVFGFQAHGHQGRGGFGISRRFFSTILPEAGGIRVIVDMQFYASDENGHHEIGSAEFVATYIRQSGEKTFSLKAVTRGSYPGTPIAREDFESLMDLEEGPSNEDLIRYDLFSLKNIAANDRDGQTRWLRAFLKGMKDTPEVLELRALLK